MLNENNPQIRLFLLSAFKASVIPQMLVQDGVNYIISTYSMDFFIIRLSKICKKLRNKMTTNKQQI